MKQHDDTIDATHLYQPDDFITLELGRVAATRVTPESLAAFKQFLVVARERHGDSKYLRMWDEIVARGPAAVSQAFTEPSERGQVLRSVISFRAFVSKDERDAIFRKHSSTEMVRQMRKSEVEAMILKCAEVSGRAEFVVIGSQAIHGTIADPDIDAVGRSPDVDIYAGLLGGAAHRR